MSTYFIFRGENLSKRKEIIRGKLLFNVTLDLVKKEHSEQWLPAPLGQRNRNVDVLPGGGWRVSGEATGRARGGAWRAGRRGCFRRTTHACACLSSFGVLVLFGSMQVTRASGGASIFVSEMLVAAPMHTCSMKGLQIVNPQILYSWL